MPSAHWRLAWTHVGNKAWESALFLAQEWPLSIEVKVQVGSCHWLSRDAAWLFSGRACRGPRSSNWALNTHGETAVSLGPHFPVHLCVLLLNSAWLELCDLQWGFSHVLFCSQALINPLTQSILRRLLGRRGYPGWEFGHFLSSGLYPEGLGEVLQVLFLFCARVLQNVLWQQ